MTPLVMHPRNTPFSRFKSEFSVFWVIFSRQTGFTHPICIMILGHGYPYPSVSLLISDNTHMDSRITLMIDSRLTKHVVSRTLLSVVIGTSFGVFLSGCGNDDASNQKTSTDTSSQPASSSNRAASPMATMPPVRITPGVLNWGDVLPGATSDGSVSLTNLGTEPLKIITVQPGCKCTTTNGLDGAVIPPGESRDLVASLDAQPSPGSRTVQIKVLFDGYSKPLEINGTAVITHPVRARPPYINAVDETKQTGSLMLSASDQIPFEILSVDGKPPRFLRKDIGPKRSVSHVISYDINDHIEADGRYRRWVVIETDHPTSPLIEVLLRHRNSSLDVNPGFKQGAYHFNMGRLQPGTSTELTHLTHDATTTGPVAMIIAEQEGVDIELLSQEVDEENDDLIIKLRVTISPDMAEGFYYFPVRVYAANDVEVTLPAFVSVRPTPDPNRSPETSAAQSIQR
ncbi:MAG TPA: hypothetical protein DCX60_10340 [Phycisphaerales bacterium]|nr:hypothetical protein [Phycisphaerales bacterium]